MVWKLEEKWKMIDRSKSTIGREENFYTERYVNDYGHNIQIGKFRKKHEVAEKKELWHNKWYVDIFPTGERRLFKTKLEAKKWAKKYMNKYKDDKKFTKEDVKKVSDD